MDAVLIKIFSEPDKLLLKATGAYKLAIFLDEVRGNTVFRLINPMEFRPCFQILGHLG